MSLSTVLLSWKFLFFILALVILFGIANYSEQILPVSGLNFIICFILVWFVSLFTSLIAIHKMLQKNKPIDFEFSKDTSIKTDMLTAVKPNSEGVKRLAEDIDKYFITKWYQYVSENNDFTSESKCVLEDILNRLLEVLMHVNSKALLHGTLNIYLRHLKEFRRTLKRKEKYGGEIEELYRYSHLSVSSPKSQKYYLHQLTINLLNHFINWELWNSLPCHALVSIIARKFTTYILNLLSSPYFLNYQLIKILGSEAVKSTLELQNYSRVSFEEFYDVQDSRIKQEEASKVVETDLNEGRTPEVKMDEILKVEKSATLETVKEVVKEKKKVCVEKKPIIATDHPADSTVKSNTVKIHEPKGASKVWTDSQDLLSVSFGMDPLDSFLSNDKPAFKNTWESKLGKTEECVEHSPTTSTNSLLNEVRHITNSMEGLKSSIKPLSDATVTTLHNIKDLQETTVNNALTKIGDFQDEAAGVVEGILDFGRAGLRKGLRLTGLQDNIQNAKAVLTNTTYSKPKNKPTRLVRSDSTEKTSSGESVDSCWINPLQVTETPNFDGQILLEKGKSAESREEVDFPIIPFISTESEDSPDPEYEEPADLESTIAKLRSLLQQKSSESNLSTPALSPMPPDEFAQKIAMNPDTVADLDEVDGMMPAFYKRCAKTATGVLHKSINTIKTALPGNTTDQFSNANGWKYIANAESEHDLLTRVHKLLSERKEFCKVDTAYEAIDSLDSMNLPVESGKVQFEDELDDFEVKLPVTKAIIDIMCELLADTDSLLLQESLIKAVMLSFGNTIEKTVVSQTENFVRNFCVNLFTIPESVLDETLYLSMDTYVSAILNSCPDHVKIVFTKKNFQRAVTLFVMSLQNDRINQDVFLQVFELLSMKLIEESIVQVSPPASA